MHIVLMEQLMLIPPQPAALRAPQVNSVDRALHILTSGTLGIQILLQVALVTASQTAGDWGRILLTLELELDLELARGWNSLLRLLEIILP